MIIQRQYTSFGYKVNAKVGRIRANIAEKLGNRILKHVDSYDSVKNIFDYPKVVDNSVYVKSIKRGKELGARTITDSTGATINTGGYSLFNSDRFNKSLQKQGRTIDKTKIGTKKLRNAISKGGNLILVHPNQQPRSVDFHAHEVGHLVNNQKHSWFNRVANTPEIQNEYRNFIDGSDKSSSIKDSVKRIIHGIAVVREENKANKNALKFLKQSDLSTDKLSQAKTNLKNASKTYKEAYKAGILSPIYRKIQIPGRK